MGDIFQNPELSIRNSRVVIGVHTQCTVFKVCMCMEPVSDALHLRLSSFACERHREESEFGTGSENTVDFFLQAIVQIRDLAVGKTKATYSKYEKICP